MQGVHGSACSSLKVLTVSSSFSMTYRSCVRTETSVGAADQGGFIERVCKSVGRLGVRGGACKLVSYRCHARHEGSSPMLCPERILPC